MGDKIRKHKVDFFLYSIIGILLITAFLPAHSDQQSYPLAVCLYAVLITLTLKIFIQNFKMFLLFAICYLGLCLLNLIAYYAHFPCVSELGVFVDLMHCIALIVLFQIMLSFLLKVNDVSSDHVKAGIGLYFLMGILWAFLYQIIYYFDASAFVFNNPNSRNLFYFSYVTLATLGYGDIIPATRVTEMLAVMEAMFAQIYMAVFISRLIGIRIANQMSLKSNG